MRDSLGNCYKLRQNVEKEVLKNLGYGAKELVRRSSNCTDEKLFEKIAIET